jgi:TM2 domain-containing membrane protein YozV
MVCPSCAKVVKSDTAKFCPECGLEFSALPPLAPQNHATSQNTYPAYAVNMGIAAGKKPVDKMAYGLLAIFLGGLGIHKFIAGKAIGILYLLFCWTFIPAIIGLIEGIMAFTQQADEQGNIYV